MDSSCNGNLPSSSLFVNVCSQPWRVLLRGVNSYVKTCEDSAWILKRHSINKLTTLGHTVQKHDVKSLKHRIIYNNIANLTRFHNDQAF